MKLIIDKSIDHTILTESTVDGEKRMYITGPFLMHSSKNKNNRIYSKKGMDKAVKEYVTEYVKTNRAMGELNHPPGRLTVDPERACILTTELTPDGNHYYGKAKVLSTPLGKVVEALLCDGVNIGVSSRGVGSVSKRGDVSYVGDDFKLFVSADIVVDPSVGEAFVSPIFEEKEYTFLNGVLVENDYIDYLNKKKELKSSDFQLFRLKKFEELIGRIKC